MELKLISERKDLNVIHRKFACPCGKAHIAEEQDHTPGHRDVLATIECTDCQKHYTIVYSKSGLKWKLYHNYSTYFKEEDSKLDRDGMARRAPYSKVSKQNQVRADHVKGMGDVVFVGFQCLSSNCTEYIFVREDEVSDDFCIECPKCGYIHRSDEETKFYDYSMDVNDENGVPISVATGSFTIFHDDYVSEAMRYKYCIVCNTMKPLGFFDRHSSRMSGRQGECRLCKKAYNEIKNGTRLSDQHREAAQKRRLLLDIAGSPKILSHEIEKRFGQKCFNCGKDLSFVAESREKPLDHTLPVFYLWPLSTENATLLCRDCNGNKSGAWPSDFYNDSQLKRLAILTGIDYSLLSGKPLYNPDAIAALHDPEKVDALLEKFAAYLPEVIKLRNRIRRDIGFDFFSVSRTISKAYIRKADHQT